MTSNLTLDLEILDTELNYFNDSGIILGVGWDLFPPASKQLFQAWKKIFRFMLDALLFTL